MCIRDSYYGDGNGFEFGQDLADDFHVTLSGDATGLEQTYIDNWKYSFAGYEISDAQIHENEIKEAEKKVAALLNYVVPEINENQNLDNQIEEPDTQTKDDSQEIQTENCLLYTSYCPMLVSLLIMVKLQ